MSCGCDVVGSEEDKVREIYIPLTEADKVPDKLEDGDFTVTIKGSMKSFVKRSGELEPWEDRGEIRMVVSDVKIDGKNVFTELAEDD